MSNSHRSCPSHCCKDHGCKYGYDDCPVVLGTVVQEFPCEDCRYDEIDLRESYGRVIADLEKQGKMTFQLSVVLGGRMDEIKPRREWEY